jgi:glycosyltransferase involved in cell wall biosynthesis
MSSSFATRLRPSPTVTAAALGSADPAAAYDDAAPRIAVLIPCYNEERTVGKVIRDFRAQLPGAAIYVFDNCCTDRTVEVAIDAGARVISEPRQGKGFVVECMFDRIDADFFVMVDGDDTYPAERVHALLAPAMAGEADMVVGARLAEFTATSFRPLHVFGNGLVRALINRIFRTRLTDILSGYRAYNARVVRRLPVVSKGFEVETELTVQMLYHRLKIAEVQVPYRERPAGSFSKLSTFRDGFRVLWKIFSLFRSFKPLAFFGALALVLSTAAVAAGLGPIEDYVEHRYVYRVPLAILATGLVLLAAGCAFLGVLLHAMNWRFMELHSVVTRRRER